MALGRLATAALGQDHAWFVHVLEQVKLAEVYIVSRQLWIGLGIPPSKGIGTKALGNEPGIGVRF